jgi:6-phosphogluconolactonase (cycloisomerase 2 family)
MKFRKFGKALLMTALSAGAVFGISSCVRSYTVGYLYVTGTQTASSTGEGIISGFKIDHNTGNLVPIAGLPVSSGGANPVRAVLLTGGRFVYVLNQGSHSDGSPCSTENPCTNANIAQFSIGGNGVLSPQGTYFTQGNNPFRMVADSTGAHIFVLDHDAPSGTGCSLVFGAQVTTCGDITAFTVDPTTGRLSYVLNSQVTAASGSPLPYFPIPADPIDFVLSGNYFLTLSGTPTTPGGDSVFPYAYNAANGQLTINQNSSQPLGMTEGTAIVVAGSATYVFDDGLNTNTPTPTNGQIFAYTVGTAGALQAEPNGYIPDSAAYSKPIYAIQASGNGKNFLYILNEGDNASTTTPQSGIAAFVITSPFQVTAISGQTGSTGGTGAGPQCILEDPSNQYVYTANFNSSTVTGLSIDQNDGNLTPLSQATKAKDSYALPGPGTWCIATGRTS